MLRLRLNPMIPAELTDFLQSGLSALVGTCDASLRPACCRAVGVVVHEGGERMTLYVPEVAGARVIANVRENARVARSEEHTSELQSLAYLVCRLLLEKK